MATLPNSVPNNLDFNWDSMSILHTDFQGEAAFLLSKLLQRQVFSRSMAANASVADLTP